MFDEPSGNVMSTDFSGDQTGKNGVDVRHSEKVFVSVILACSGSLRLGSGLMEEMWVVLTGNIINVFENYVPGVATCHQLLL